MDYLPKDATIEQACNWLHAKTGQTWVLPRLLECHLQPYFWLDYAPGYPVIFGSRIEGYQTRMMFQGDLCRLESDGTDALVNMYVAHNGALIKSAPPLRVPLSELRFKREDVERVAEIINKTAQPQAAAPAPVVADSASNAAGNGKVWTPEKLAEVQAYREKYGTKKAAEHFKVSASLIRQKLPSKKPQPKGYSAFTHRIK